MSYGIGANVEVITTTYLGRWIYPGERGEVISRHASPAGQDRYVVQLEDGGQYVFAPDEIRELIEA